MLHDILGELQLEENISVILSKFFIAPNLPIWPLFIFKYIRYDTHIKQQ